ncbi:hypothetical protein U1Q18_042330 [Sarracenia purpurea var. burkii]
MAITNRRWNSFHVIGTFRTDVGVEIGSVDGESLADFEEGSERKWGVEGFAEFENCRVEEWRISQGV